MIAAALEHDGPALLALKAVLSGHGDKLIDLAETNLGR
jgi:hypothetical protein